MKIVIPDGDTLAIPEMKKRIQELFPKFGEVICSGTTNPEEVAQKIGDADVVLCNKTPITREVMNQCPNLKYIGLFATGYNNIDIPSAIANITTNSKNPTNNVLVLSSGTLLIYLPLLPFTQNTYFFPL